MNKATRLHRVLDTGDLELRFHDNRTIKAHSQKLKIASLDGCLHQLIDVKLDDQSNKRKRADSDDTNAIPSLKVLVPYMLFDTNPTEPC